MRPIATSLCLSALTKARYIIGHSGDLLRGIMRLSRLALSAAGSFAALGLALALTAAQAQAQQPRRVVRAEGPNTERITIIDETGRVRTKITVRPRSYLDPGKEQARAFEQPYHDYAIVPNGARGVPQTYATDYRFSLDAPGIIGPLPGSLRPMSPE
jgi:hypothetical protein